MDWGSTRVGWSGAQATRKSRETAPSSVERQNRQLQPQLFLGPAARGSERAAYRWNAPNPGWSLRDRLHSDWKHFKRWSSFVFHVYSPKMQRPTPCLSGQLKADLFFLPQYFAWMQITFSCRLWRFTCFPLKSHSKSCKICRERKVSSHVILNFKNVFNYSVKYWQVLRLICVYKWQWNL